MNPYVVAVCGGYHCSDETIAMAEEVGRRIAEAGALLICGGLAGVMEAACRGAAQAGGTTIGILPGTSRREANPWVSIPIATAMNDGRNPIIIRSADAVIAIDGEFGTLSEIAYAAKMRKPIIGLGTWEVSHPEGIPDPVIRAATAAEAVEHALALAAESRSSALGGG